MRARLAALRQRLSDWKNRLWLTSTIAEIDRDTHAAVRIPGQFPAAEQSVWGRLIRSIRGQRA